MLTTASGPTNSLAVSFQGILDVRAGLELHDGIAGRTAGSCQLYVNVQRLYWREKLRSTPMTHHSHLTQPPAVCSLENLVNNSRESLTDLCSVP